MRSHVFKRLLAYPHAAVFDKAPDDSLAFRLRHPDGARWKIDDGWMDAWAGDARHTYDLSAGSVAMLVAALGADGFEVLQTNARFNGLSAMVLVDGAGDQGQSNGDHVTAFTSLLWVLFSGYAAELDVIHYQIRQALLQMVLTTADGEWLDLWGELYGVARLQYETDVAYRLRIPAEAFRLRVNALAIEKAILDITGKVVRILEPWTTVFVLDDSELDGDEKTQDSTHVGYFFIQPESGVSIDWSDVLPVIERNRPAGVLMLPPQVRNSAWIVVDPVYGASGFSIQRRHVGNATTEDLALLDYMNIEDVSTLNCPFMLKRSIRHLGLNVTPPSAPWAATPWVSDDWSFIKYTYSLRHESRQS